MFCVHPETIAKIDDYAEKVLKISRRTLMKNAGEAAAREILRRVAPPARILFLCGAGNNGGDGYVAARSLFLNGYDVAVLNVFGGEPKTEVSRHYRRRYLEVADELCLPALSEAALAELVDSAVVVVEAIFGTGFRASDKGLPVGLAELIAKVNQSRALRVAMDAPLGVNGKSGQVADCVFAAHLTLTMLLPKIGFYQYPARRYVGEIAVCDIGLDPDRLAGAFGFSDFVTDGACLGQILRRRAPDAHKGSFGRLLLVCGSESMPGAACLAALAAARSGVGLVSVAAPAAVRQILAARLAEPVYHPIPDAAQWTEETVAGLAAYARTFDGVLVGCGVGNHPMLGRLVAALLSEAGAPLVLDADALNALSGRVEILKSKRREVVLTPHPMEFSRLSGRPVADIQADRCQVAKDFAAAYGVTLVLKGTGTVIAHPDGRAFVNPTGNSGLAKGGSGDVLAGLVASLVAQGNTPFDAAVAGVYLHGLAADRLRPAYSEYGLLPSDLPAEIGRLLGEAVK